MSENTGNTALVAKLRELANDKPPPSYHNDGFIDSVVADAFALKGRHPELSDTYSAFQRAVGALHPKTYTIKRWEDLQSAAENLLVALQALES